MTRAPNAAAIPPVIYRNPGQPDLPVEILSLTALRTKAPAAYLARPQRPTFHQVHVVTRGQCELEVDFERVPLDRGAVAWVRPGQVQRFDLRAGVEGWLLMFTPDVVDAELVHEVVGPHIALGEAGGDVAWLLDRMRRLSGEPVHEAQLPLLRHLLHALLLELHRRAHSSRARIAAPARAIFAMFRTEVERRFATTRRVQDYQRIIGYSAKTLTRAARAATGSSAKQYIDQRVLLESRRLLAHTSLSVGDIAQRLGFSEPTNFNKFFRREGGESPAAFRGSGAPARAPSPRPRPATRAMEIARRPRSRGAARGRRGTRVSGASPSTR